MFDWWLRGFLLVGILVAVVIMLAAPAMALWAVLKDRRLMVDGNCPACSYDLTGNLSGVCPECGHRFRTP